MESVGGLSRMQGVRAAFVPTLVYFMYGVIRMQ